MEERDVIVIGGGSAGEVLASEVAGAGLSVVLVENRLVGGQCPFWACMPAKALLRPGQVVREAGGVPGVAVPAMDVEAVFAWRDEVSDHWDDAGHVQELKRDGVELLRGRGRVAGERVVEIKTDENGSDRRFRASRAVVIATGARPAPLPVDGSEDVEVWTSETVTTTSSVPDRMLIVGGGPVGLESAQAFSSFGSQVIVVEAEDRLLSREEPFVGEMLAAELERRGVDIVTGTTVVTLEQAPNGVVAGLSSGGTVEVERVVSALGSMPNTEDLGLAELGLEEGEEIPVDDSMRVIGHEGWLYSIGDVNGRSMFTHSAKLHARVAAQMITGSVASAASSEKAVPRCVFTDPAVAATGLTEAEARQSSDEVSVTTADLGMMAESGIWAGEVRGHAQCVWMADRLVGATLVGPAPVLELLASFQMAILGELPVARLREFVPQFPSFSEAWLDLLPTRGARG